MDDDTDNPDDSVFYQVQSLFGHLMESKLQYYVPENFWKVLIVTVDWMLDNIYTLALLPSLVIIVFFSSLTSYQRFECSAHWYFQVIRSLKNSHS